MSTTTANQGLPVPQSSDEPDVPAFIVALAEAAEKKLVMVFTNSTQRTTKVPSPTSGMMSVLTDTDVVEFYDGATWQRVYPPAVPAFTRGTVVPSNGSGANGDVFFKLS
jgi:hypothetical protein